MPKTDPSQLAADRLIGMPKFRAMDETYEYPRVGNSSIPLVSEDRRENFYLDIWRSGIALAK
jgi:hypothetical protein